MLVSYEGGGMCSFSINGKLQKALVHDEDIQVRRGEGGLMGGMWVNGGEVGEWGGCG